jgi:hypothetical protein
MKNLATQHFQQEGGEACEGSKGTGATLISMSRSARECRTRARGGCPPRVRRDACNGCHPHALGIFRPSVSGDVAPMVTHRGRSRRGGSAAGPAARNAKKQKGHMYAGQAPPPAIATPTAHFRPQGGWAPRGSDARTGILVHEPHKLTTLVETLGIVKNFITFLAEQNRSYPNFP